MASQKHSALRFVDAHPFPASKREQELIRAEARSHAASVSHSKYKRQAADFANDANENATEQPASSGVPLTKQTEVPDATKPAFLIGTPHVQSPFRANAKPWKKFNQSNRLFHRYRVATQNLSKDTPRKANIGRKRKELDGVDKTLQVVPTRTSIPVFKGNTDPFDATVVPFSALEHLLLQQARAQSTQNTWPSEIVFRRNHTALTAETLRKMPPFISDKASSHALISHAYYSGSSRQRIRGQAYEQSFASGERHKFQALRTLQESIVAQHKTGDTTMLKRIFDACCWLSAAEMLSGNVHAATVHLLASRKIIETMGGWSVIPRMEKEILLGAVVNLAAGLRTRPVMDIGDFDPGPWATRQWSPEPRDSSALYDDLKVASAETDRTPSHRPTSISSRLRAIIDDMKELLAMEDLKFKYALSKARGTTQIFRWSHARKVSIRWRALHYWCDLNEAAKRDEQPVLILQVPVRVGLALPSALALNHEFALCAAMRTFDRCIFEEHYQPGGVFRESKRYHMELAALMEALRPSAVEYSLTPDDRCYDILWIYSVGAYLEDVFMRPELKRKGDPVPHQDRFFSPRFSYLVATNLEFSRFEDVTTLLVEDYLYYPQLQDESLRKLIAL